MCIVACQCDVCSSPVYRTVVGRGLKAKHKPNRRNNYRPTFKTNLSQQATGFRSRKHVPGDGTAHNAPHRSERWNPASSASTFTFTKATSPKGRSPTSSSSATSLSPKPEPIVSDGLIQNVEFCVYRLNNGCRSYAIPKRDLFRILAKLKFKLSKEVNPVRASSPIGRIATVDHQDHALGHRSCVSVSEARAYRKRRQGCISIVPVHSMKGALCNEKVFFMFRIDKSL